VLFRSRNGLVFDFETVCPTACEKILGIAVTANAAPPRFFNTDRFDSSMIFVPYLLMLN